MILAASGRVSRRDGVDCGQLTDLIANRVVGVLPAWLPVSGRPVWLASAAATAAAAAAGYAGSSRELPHRLLNERGRHCR